MNITQPGAAQTNVAALNKILCRCLESQEQKQHEGRLYIVVHKEASTFDLTDDKQVATPMSDVIAAIDIFTEQICKNGAVKRRDICTLAHDFETLSIKYLGHIFSKFSTKDLQDPQAQKISQSNKQVFNIKKRLADYLDTECQSNSLVSLTKAYSKSGLEEDLKGEYDYGKYKTYAKAAEKKLEKRFEAEKKDLFCHFEHAQADMLSICRAFKIELCKVFSTRYTKEKAIHELTNGCFYDALDYLSCHIEEGNFTPKEAVDNFSVMLKKQLCATNEKLLKLDRETFCDLIGEIAEGGRCFRVPDSLDTMTEEFKECVAYFNAGKWQKNETRYLKCIIIDNANAPKLKVALDKLTNHPTFKNLLTIYFENLKK